MRRPARPPAHARKPQAAPRLRSLRQARRPGARAPRHPRPAAACRQPSDVGVQQRRAEMPSQRALHVVDCRGAAQRGRLTLLRIAGLIHPGVAVEYRPRPSARHRAQPPGRAPTRSVASTQAREVGSRAHRRAALCPGSQRNNQHSNQAPATVTCGGTTRAQGKSCGAYRISVSSLAAAAQAASDRAASARRRPSSASAAASLSPGSGPAGAAPCATRSAPWSDVNYMIEHACMRKSLEDNRQPLSNIGACMHVHEGIDKHEW